jgi:hypothetical protein
LNVVFITITILTPWNGFFKRVIAVTYERIVLRASSAWRHEATVTVQFSPESDHHERPTTGSALVGRFVRACNDPEEERIRMRLVKLGDAELP